jgi:hypothetical protein
LENLGIWRIWEFGDLGIWRIRNLENLGIWRIRNLENLGIWRIWEFREFRNLENLGEIVEFEESKTRSEEGILRSLRTCVQKHVARSFLQSLFGIRSLLDKPTAPYLRTRQGAHHRWQ